MNNGNSKSLLEPRKSLISNNTKDKEETLQPQQQQPIVVKEPEVFGIPFSQIKDGLVVSSLAFTAIIGAKVFLIDPYIAMVQRQNEQAMMERQAQMQRQQQVVMPKQMRVIDNTINNQPIQGGFGQLDIPSVDNTDTARNMVVSNDVRPKPNFDIKEFDNTASSNPYGDDRFIIPEKPAEMQYQPALVQPRSTNSRPLSAGQASTAGQWPTAKSWPPSTHPSQTSVTAVEPRPNGNAADEEVDTGVASISAAPAVVAPQKQQTQQPKQPQPTVLEQQLANDADNYYYLSR